MKNMERTADFTLWTPWGPELKKAAKPKIETLRRTLGRIKSAKAEADKRDREDQRLGKPECAYEP